MLEPNMELQIQVTLGSCLEPLENPILKAFQNPNEKQANKAHFGQFWVECDQVVPFLPLGG